MDGEEEPTEGEKEYGANTFHVHGANNPIIGDGTTVYQNTDTRTVTNIFINVNPDCAKGIHSAINYKYIGMY